MRHLIRHHNHEREVKDILQFPVKSKERRQALGYLKSNTNFELYLKGTIRPKKQLSKDSNMDYYPCVYCKTLYSKSFLHRHVKMCTIKKKNPGSKTKSSLITLSQTAVACALDPTDVISKLNIKEQVILLMNTSY